MNHNSFLFVFCLFSFSLLAMDDDQTKPPIKQVRFSAQVEIIPQTDAQANSDQKSVLPLKGILTASAVRPKRPQRNYYAAQIQSPDKNRRYIHLYQDSHDHHSANSDNAEPFAFATDFASTSMLCLTFLTAASAIACEMRDFFA